MFTTNSPAASGPVLVNAPPHPTVSPSSQPRTLPSPPSSVSVAKKSAAPSATQSKISSQTSSSPAAASSSSSLPHSPETMRQIQESRAALLAQMNSVGQSATADLQARAVDLHSNSKAVEKQEKELQKAVGGLGKERGKLEGVVKEGTKVVKELGNVQNWAEMLERDFLVLQETMRLANGESDSESSWSSYSGSESGDEVPKDERHGGADFQKDDEIPVMPAQLVVDGDGDVSMDNTHIQSDDLAKGKGKESRGVPSPEQKDVEMQTENAAGSSSATMVGSASVSGTEPSGSESLHTVHSGTSSSGNGFLLGQGIK